jgi:predicted DNA-binding mobile mystery protein A
MTTAQVAKRLGVAQTRVSRIEAAEVNGSITLRTLERAAEALDCRLVYVLIPVQPLQERMERRAFEKAERQYNSVQQTMKLEDQAVISSKFHTDAIEQIAQKLLKKPSKLWNEG